VQVPSPSRGGGLLEWAVALLKGLKADRIIPGDGITLTATPSGRVAQAKLPRWSGIVYLAGKQFDLTASQVKTYIAVDAINGTVTLTDTAPSDPFPPGVEYYRTAYVYGDLHVTRFG
jgi:hypothetical protein